MQTQAGRLIAWISERQRLAPFQRRWIRGAFAPGCYKAILCGPRGLGKSTLSAHLLAAALDPAGPLHRPGAESILLASSLDQARIPFTFLRQICAGPDFRWMDSAQRVAVTHVPSGARVRVASSDAKKAFGLGANTPLITGDEPGAWQERGGSLMHDALETSTGKAECRVVLIGTKAPGTEGGWWRTLIDAGSDPPGTYAQVHSAEVDDDGDVPGWHTWKTIRRANPLIGFNPHLRPKLADELRKAHRDEDARRRFCTYRLNAPQRPARSVLFTVDQWRTVEARAVPAASGRPVIGIDTGSSRAWSTAAILWPSGRLDAICIAPGIPDLAEQERRDGKRRGMYQRLADAGLLTVDEGRRVVRVSTLIDRVRAFRPQVLVADRFREGEVRDAVKGRVPVVLRKMRQTWSEPTEQIQATRRMALDGSLAVVPAARPLYRLALAETTVEHDDSGNVRLVKMDTNNTHRDDLCAALVLACGQMARRPARRKARLHVA